MAYKDSKLRVFTTYVHTIEYFSSLRYYKRVLDPGSQFGLKITAKKFKR